VKNPHPDSAEDVQNDGALVGAAATHLEETMKHQQYPSTSVQSSGAEKYFCPMCEDVESDTPGS